LSSRQAPASGLPGTLLTPLDGITLQTKIAANAHAMKRWLGKSEVVLGNHSDRLNAINIFPVADGDTGTNLYLTVRAAVSALEGTATDTAETGNDVGAVLSRAGQAAMEQARGNSGTLFAVFLCAAAEPLAGKSRLSAPLLATALNRAQIRAWSALSEPVAGTMLSVLEAAAHAAQAVDAAHNSDDSNHALGLSLDAVVEAAFQAVVRTEDELAQLHEAHVVDAGGVGMLLVLDCLRSAVLGEALQDELLDGLHGYKLQDPHIHEHMPADDGVEVMCTISLSPLNAAILRQRLDEMGDSVIMSQVGNAPGPDDDDDLTAEPSYRWRVHVHVPDPEPAVALIRSLGEPTDIAVSQLALPRDNGQEAATRESAGKQAPGIQAPGITGQTRHDH
jgi:dihydroxyacetone kinase-like predicted kinase